MSCIRKYIVIFEHRTISAVVHVIWFNWNQSEDGIILFYSPNMLIKHKCTCIILYDIYIRMYHVVFEVVASAWNTSCLLPHWQGPEELAWLQPLPWHCREATRPCIKPVDGSYFPASTTERMHIKKPVVNDVGVQLPVVQLLSVGFFQKLRPFVFQMHNHGSPGKNHGGLKKNNPTQIYTMHILFGQIITTSPVVKSHPHDLWSGKVWLMRTTSTLFWFVPRWAPGSSYKVGWNNADN